MAYHPTIWIALSDGTRLAASLWLPDGEGPFPCVLEYLPYRRGDGTAARDQSTYPHFAEAGIAGLRVDSRGQGDSEGLFDDEYSPQELADACEVIAWAAAQDWSNGRVGMMGISWGGFNALQVAAMRPPALGAVISIASTSDRFADDIHYKGGCQMGAHLSWAATMLAYNSRPPDPEVVGGDWRAIWQDRIEAQPFLLETWLDHQRRDDFWRHGSIREDWSAIECPVWVIAGWADGYRNTPATLARHLKVPVKAMVGPWVHKYPHFAWPLPRADFLGMATDWWREWLAGEDRGCADWPDYTVYRLENVRPAPRRERDPGRWIATDWPGDGKERSLALGADLQLGSTDEGEVVIASPAHCGTMAGEWFTLAPDADLPGDQRSDDGLSVCWEMPVGSALDLLGRAVVELPLSVDQAEAHLIARLCDVHPDGTSALVARGVLNLAHRAGPEAPRPMEPGRTETIRLELDEMAYRVLPGHRLRLALSTSYWPMIQPPEAAATARVAAGSGAVLTLPLAGSVREVEVAEPPRDTLPEFPVHARGHRTRGTEHDLTEGVVHYRVSTDTGLLENPANGMRWRETHAELWSVRPDDPGSAEADFRVTTLREREGWQARTEGRFNVSSHDGAWHVEGQLAAWDGDDEVARRRWSLSIPRDHM